jgi:3-phenylpropionate/trans-cinnamate dioxygenase ferredoxin reductase subunit
MERIAIVGMSMAGLRAAETLRRIGHTGAIVAVSAEAHDPYDRPPLSKELLAGTREPADIVLRRDGVGDLGLEWRRGVRATALDVDRHVVTLDDGTEVAYDGVLLATGASPRRLPAAVCDPTLQGVHVLRTLDDALALRDDLDAEPRRVCVVGAGFIGAEVAATCRGRGLDVTVLEALEQPMVRGLGVELGKVCAQLHRDHGVDLRLGVQIERVEGDTSRQRVSRVVLAGGEVVECDVLVVGIGVAPETDWLERSGLRLDNGVVCDESCLAAPGVVACGDLARWPNPLFDGELMRLEHWTNATEQSVHAAERLHSGIPNPFAPVPFVWSDQYDCKIQSVGRFDANDAFEVAHGDLESRKFVAIFQRKGRLTGALGFSQPRHVMRYRAMIARRATFDEALEYART